MKKFISMVLALVMALSLTTVAWATPTGTGSASDPWVVANETDLKQAFKDGGYVKLGADITLTNTKTSTFTDEWAVVPVVKTVTLDLAGYDITRNVNDTLGAIRVLGELIVNDSVGGGTISDLGYAVVVGYWKTEGAGAKLTINGGTFTGGAYAISGNGNAPTGNNTTNWGTTITINGGTITGGAVGIYHPQVGTLTINDGTISGATGVEVRGGTLEITGGEISATSSTYSSVANGNGATSTGVAVAVAQHTTKQAIDVTISGGELNGVKAFAEENPEQNTAPAVTIDITDGEFNGDVVVTDDQSTEISGGTINGNVDEDLLAPGMQLLANGTVVTTPAAGAVAPTLYVWDTAAKDWATYYIATGDDLDDLKLGADENCLPCYFIDGRYFVDTTEAAATYKLVYGATKLFLAPVDVTDVRYLDKATVFTNVTKETDECGKLVVTDTTKTYYVAYDENNYDEDYYFVATKNGPVQLLVGGKIVDVAPNGAQDLTAHVWKGHDVVNNAYTTAKCENCGKVVKLYATGTAAGKGAHYEAGLGYITKIDNGFGPAVVTPSTDKVTSAETFDAGIAMYVGMSVMAAAGSAVVLKKKD